MKTVPSIDNYRNSIIKRAESLVLQATDFPDGCDDEVWNYVETRFIGYLLYEIEQLESTVAQLRRRVTDKLIERCREEDL